MNVAQKLIASHLVHGSLRPGDEIGLRVEQTLTQDATGTLVMLELEAMGLERVTTVSAQYVDHNLIQEDHKNADDHLFLRSASRRFGIWYSRAGNGVSHPVHQELFAKPGVVLVGSDSHTPASGALGLLAIGAGGLEVALCMAGEPLWLTMPEVWGVTLTGALPPWVSAKDVILEMLRRHGVEGGLHRIIEYRGPGLACLSAMDRHVIANMGAELGATTSVFPADAEAERFLRAVGRGDDFTEIVADDDATYDVEEHIDLSTLEPLIAVPSSPGNVVPVREVAGAEVHQCYVGSSANPGYRDFAIAALIVDGKRVHERVSLDVNPTSRFILERLVEDGHITRFLRAGARLHQAGCNGCVGMGQAPATEKLSLRTVPRNFPGRSGTREDKVCLVSPETAAASALTGVITDPRTLPMAYPTVTEKHDLVAKRELLIAPVPLEEARQTALEKGPNIRALPDLTPTPDTFTAPVLLVLGDDVSTDEIMPAGARVLPFRSNIPEISAFAFERVDPTYVKRAHAHAAAHVVVAGRNYGQGSSREHAALAPRYLGLLAVIARGFARIHQQNLINFGVLPLVLADDATTPDLADELVFSGLHAHIRNGGGAFHVDNRTRGTKVELVLDITARQGDVLLAGGLIPWMKARLGGTAARAHFTDRPAPRMA